MAGEEGGGVGMKFKSPRAFPSLSWGSLLALIGEGGLSCREAMRKARFWQSCRGFQAGDWSGQVRWWSQRRTRGSSEAPGLPQTSPEQMLPLWLESVGGMQGRFLSSGVFSPSSPGGACLTGAQGIRESERL